MKNELKISTLSIVCVLCASMALPSYGASSVRSLGGAGTYSSASSAATAKSSGDSTGGGAINSVRAGSVRVNNVAGATGGATRSGSTRAATTPRLSIGKYLAGSSAVSGGSSISGSHKPGKPSGGESSGEVADVTYLEEFVGYSPSGDTLPEQLAGIVLRVDELEKDITAQLGVVTDVVFDDVAGTLTVTVAGEDTPVVYNLSDYFDGRIEEALQEVLDDVVAPDGAVTVLVNEVVNEALEDFEVPDSSITVNKLAAGAVTADKINTGTGNEGEMLMLISNGDGTSSWVTVTVDAEEQE